MGLAAIFSTHHFQQIFFLPRFFQPSCNGNRFENDSPRGSRIEFSNPTLRSRVLNISTQVTIKWHCFSVHCLFFSSTYQNKISIFLVLLRRKTTGWVFFVWLTMDYSFWTECCEEWVSEWVLIATFRLRLSVLVTVNSVLTDPSIRRTTLWEGLFRWILVVYPNLKGEMLAAKALTVLFPPTSWLPFFMTISPPSLAVPDVGIRFRQSVTYQATFFSQSVNK